jgi:hypothetical protein
MKQEKSIHFLSTNQNDSVQALGKELSIYGEIEGMNNAKHNKPEYITEFKTYLLNPLHSKIQIAIEENQKQHLGVSGMFEAQKHQQDANEKIKPLQSTLEDEAHKKATLEQKKNDCKPDLKKRLIRKWINIGVIILSILEGYFIFRTFQISGLSSLESLLYGLGVGLVLGLATHLLAGFLQNWKNRRYFWLKLVAITIPVFVIFLYFGSMRATMYSTAQGLNIDPTATTNNQSSVSGILLAMISFCMFFVALFAAAKYHKTKAEKVQDGEYDKVCKEIIVCDKKQKEIQKEISLINEDASIKSIEALQRYEYAKSTEQQLKAIAVKVINDYIAKNVRHRTDNHIPEFFSNPPQLHFTSFFDNLNNNQS